MSPKVLVAVDDSETAHEAARFVSDLFRSAEVEVLGVNVAPRPRPWIAPGIGYGMVMPVFPPPAAEIAVVDDDDLAHDARSRAAQTLCESGLDDAAAIGAVGDPVDAIVTAALDHDVDLIVVGGDDRGFLGRLLDRSVARALLREAGLPVLVIPPATDPGEPDPAEAEPGVG